MRPDLTQRAPDSIEPVLQPPRMVRPPRQLRRLLTLVASTALLATAVSASVGPGAAMAGRPGNNVLAHALDVELGTAARGPKEQLPSSGTMYPVLQESGALAPQAFALTSAARPRSHVTLGCQNVFTGGGAGGPNIRINQDCSLRRQAEEVIAVNPTDRSNLIAGQNDSRIGFNHCGYDFSFDGGRTWGDQVPPFYQFILEDGHTADACSDPTATFDAEGNAYVGGVLFDITSAASAFVVAKSNAGIGGAYWHTPQAGAFQEYSDSPLGVVASDNDPNIAHDKEFIVADATASSPKANNVYATWTRFDFNTGAGVGGHSPIDFSQSTDGGATWSPGIEISGSNAAACTAFSGEADAHACDQDQGSHPIVGRDGTIYVAFGNGNTPTTGLNQHMIVSCPASADCSNPASWTAPAKIADDYGMQPFGPDASTGCSAGRQCLPPNGYRMDDFVEGSISIDNNGTLYAVWADFRNGAANCNPNGAADTATTPCNNDVFYAFSTDGGATWSTAANLTAANRFGKTAQWMPWSAVSPDGRSLWVAFYDRSYGSCETTGCNDITLARVSRAATKSPSFAYTRLTTSSMPNLLPSNDPLEAGFLGDYMWVTVDNRGNPYVVWADTRGQDGTVEEDVYLARP
jgi:hypothetical protein